MENILENKLSMYQKVQGFMNLNAASLTTFPILTNLRTQLDTKVNAILAVASNAGADITGFTVDKQAKRADLKAKTLKLSTAIVAHAAMTDNYKLKEKCDESPSKLDYMRDNDFYTYARLVISECTPILASLAGYGVSAADLSLATNSASAYLAVIQSPRIQINERSRSLTDIENLFSDTDAFLRDKLDQVMKLYISANPSIYNGYMGARSIDQTGSATAPDYSGQVPPATTIVVANIPYLASRTFEIENTGNGTLNFSLSTSDTQHEGTVLSIENKKFSTRLSSNLNTNETATKVLLQNPNTEQAVGYKIWVIE